MATDILAPPGAAGLPFDDRPERGLPETLIRLLTPLASLRITVALFAGGVFLIFAGTMAQATMDVWEVVHGYFRAWGVLIPLQIFFPPVFFPSRPAVHGWIPYPGGLTFLTAAAINLLAAHTLRFKIQARGLRLFLGLATIGLGVALLWAVVVHGSGKEMPDSKSGEFWSQLWWMMKMGVTALWGVTGYGLTQVPPERRLERQLLTVASLILMGLVGWLWLQGDAAKLADPSLRILWQLIEGALVGLVLLAGAALIFRRKAGIVVLHAGVGLMMANELVVYGLHAETQMSLQEGETKNYAEDIRTVELAVIDRSAAEFDEVAVVPKQRLLESAEDKTKLSSGDLPFDIEVVRFLKNSEMWKAKPGEPNDATAGAGLAWVAEEKSGTVGASADSKVNIAAAYVKLFEKSSGRELGEYLFDQELLPQPVEVDGKTYHVALRFERAYKPYSLTLNDIRADVYANTSIAKGYRAELQLVDPELKVDRPVSIWMNNPLRFAGETFYQSGYEKNEKGEATVVSIVANVGWMLPYVACMIVVVGLLAHFSLTLTRFLGGADKRPRAADERSFASLAVLGLGLLFVGGMAFWPASRPEGMDLAAFGELPVKFEGRVKPVDTLARNFLQVVSNRETYLDEQGKRQPALRWLLDVATHSPSALKSHVFRIDNPEVLDTLGIKERDPKNLYSILQFRDRLPKLDEQLSEIEKLNAANLSPYQRKVAELSKRLRLYMTMSAPFDEPLVRPGHQQDDLMAAVSRAAAMAKVHPPQIVPPTRAEDSWQTLYNGSLNNILVAAKLFDADKNSAATNDISAILSAYEKRDATAFNDKVAAYHAWLAQHGPADYVPRKVDFESFFNRFAPLFDATVLYVAAFALTVLSWLVWTAPLNKSARMAIALAFLTHTFALLSRIYISDRPPVTTLHSAAIFIGWGCVLLGLGFEYVYRIGVGNIVASIAGLASLLVADGLIAGAGDSFPMLQAVLDTNFWLGTHVVCVTFGYATMFVAGLLGAIYILGGCFTRALTPAVAKDISRMTYGVLCFAILFSFFGTVLGGLWADDSWGRFWGWDPKENGALMIVFWSALALHARWGGLVRQRGLAALAVAGNIVTAWSMFGVNELGQGLHSYGFTEGALLKLGLFALSQLAVIGLALLPPRMWPGFRPA